MLWRDAHAGPDGEYFIRSVYFDDRANSAYYEKLDGGPARDKYRIRIYGLNEKQIYLERKRKLGELIAKDSVHITRRLAEQILSGNPICFSKCARIYCGPWCAWTTTARRSPSQFPTRA